MSQGTREHSCQSDDMALPGSDRILWEVSPKRYGHSECLFTRSGQEKKVCVGKYNWIKTICFLELD